MSRRNGIALAIRVRDEWDLVHGLLLQLKDAVHEVWILDDASTTWPPSNITGFDGLPTYVFRAAMWSGEGGSFGEGAQRDKLLQMMKRDSRCEWVLQLDADERIANPAGLLALTRQDKDAWVMPLVDYYITPGDADLVDRCSPQEVRHAFGPEVRWTLVLFRLQSWTFVSRGDVREPQGFRRARIGRSTIVIEHYGKSISVEDWDRKARFYIEHYPAYREKWKDRLGKAVHESRSDFGHVLRHRGDLTYEPELAPVIHSYVPDVGIRTAVKALVLGLLGRVSNRTAVDRVRA